jgi:hypothetical protein
MVKVMNEAWLEANEQRSPIPVISDSLEILDKLIPPFSQKGWRSVERIRGRGQFERVRSHAARFTDWTLQTSVSGVAADR